MKFLESVILIFCIYNLLVFSCSDNKSINSNKDNEVDTFDSTVTDIDNNVYKAIKIGNQWWMAENLKVTHYRNGEAILNVTDDTEWYNLDTSAMCMFNNDTNNVAIYGLLYNGYAVKDTRNIAPEGWHVPTDEEWKVMEMNLGMTQSEADAQGIRGTEGDKLKAASGWNYAGNGTNISGFTGLPGGFRIEGGGLFEYIGYWGCFWTSTEHGSNGGFYRLLDCSNPGVFRFSAIWRRGSSVRCVRD